VQVVSIPAVKFAICNEIFEGWKIEDAMSFARRTGYDGIEIAPFTLAGSVNEISVDERRRLREMAQRIGIEISGIHWVLVKTEGLHLTSSDSAVRNRTSDYFCSLVDFCADIGGRYIVVGSPKQRNILEGLTYDQAWRWATDVFRASVKRAGERNITICLEPLAPSETNFINTAEEAIRFVQQFNSPHFKIILDVKAMCSETKTIPRIINDSSPHFAHFHANDRNLKGPGFGDVDFVPIASALKSVGYNDYVSVEVFDFTEGPEVIASKSYEYLRRVFGI
jgi:sugar phosphate isomerase/epimerase